MNELLNKLLGIYECPTCFGATELSEGDCERCRYSGANYAKLTKAPKPTGASFTYVTPVGNLTVRADPTVQPGSMRIEGSPDGKNWHVIGVDFGSEPSRSVVSTTCTRCSATIDPAAVEQHHAVCFRVGDYVRWERATNVRLWAEGEVLSIATDGKHCYLRVDRTGDAWPGGGQILLGECRFDGPHWKTVRLRHIQRPGQAVRSCCPGATTGHVCGCDPLETRAAAYHKLASEAPGPIGCAHGDDDDELQDALGRIEPTAPTLYDGMTAEECLFWYERSQRNDGPGMCRRDLSTAQLTAARDLWSQQLRARISAAKERERLSVTYCEVDAEDEPW